MTPTQVSHKIKVYFEGSWKPPKENPHRTLKEQNIDYDKPQYSSMGHAKEPHVCAG
jgi:hypothetical protein